ncbi:MAG: 4Fe-4S dicluster domain-containing protein [Thermoplasmata archaeon]|nr:4Fe-4S dicluster domain-containing protein [Thermoplasmata archaeon]
MTGPTVGSRWILERRDLDRLIGAFRGAGYKVVGPTVRDGAIVYGEIRTDTDLPVGWTERQSAGSYRLERRTDAAVFGFAVGPHSWRRFLSPPREVLWTAVRTPDGFEIRPTPSREPPLALLGVRACEIAAMRVTDRVFDGPVKDPGYVARRDRALRIAVQCGEPGGTCFCVSMGTGPVVRDGFDLSLTEILDARRHHFVVEVGSEKGAAVLDGVPLRSAESPDRADVDAVVARSEARMGRTFAAEGAREVLANNLEHPRWEIVAKRCLSCANCTMVCPTCFCSTTEEVPDLTGTSTERSRRWDSCFNVGFTQLHVTSVRTSPQSRYRQWLTHKLSTWHDQFGVSGCVGCGRCITWCPVGIDLTEEVAAIRVPAPTPTAPEKAP